MLFLPAADIQRTLFSTDSNTDTISSFFRGGQYCWTVTRKSRRREKGYRRQPTGFKETSNPKLNPDHAPIIAQILIRRKGLLKTFSFGQLWNFPNQFIPHKLLFGWNNISDKLLQQSPPFRPNWTWTEKLKRVHHSRLIIILSVSLFSTSSWENK